MVLASKNMTGSPGKKPLKPALKINMGNYCSGRCEPQRDELLVLDMSPADRLEHDLPFDNLSI